MNAMRTMIGKCGVDSGQIMIVDPCYVIDNKFGEYEYKECCTVTLADAKAGQIMNDLAVVSSSGIGDGYYPVYATYDDVPGWGERITKLEIDFTDHIFLQEEEEFECLRCGAQIDQGEEYCWQCEEINDESEEDA